MRFLVPFLILISALVGCEQYRPSEANCFSFVARGPAEKNCICGWLLHCKCFLVIFAVFSSVLSSVRPVYVLALPPLALMSSANEVPIGLSTSKGRCRSLSVLALG